jgi:hypothetical protein
MIIRRQRDDARDRGLGPLLQPRGGAKTCFVMVGGDDELVDDKRRLELGEVLALRSPGAGAKRASCRSAVSSPSATMSTSPGASMRT